MRTIREFVIALVFFAFCGLLAVATRRARQGWGRRHAGWSLLAYTVDFMAFAVVIGYVNAHPGIFRSIVTIATILLSAALLVGLVVLITRRVNH